MVQTVYICACAEKGAGGGVYKYALQESGALEKKAYLPCDKPMFAAADGGKLHILLRAPFEGQSFVNPLARAARGAPCTRGTNWARPLPCLLSTAIV